VPGTALGLAIAKTIAEGHRDRRGQHRGRGTSFRVELPAVA
jgi:signal transduction histidine kinase